MKNHLLRGITWNHSRALPPLVTTGQRFEELNPGVQITWQKRSLHEFGHADLATLSRSFDLLVIDHPMMGDAEATDALLNLRPKLTVEDFNELRNDSLGPCFDSYLYNEKLYALPIDAAAPAASFRYDLLTQAEAHVPRRWNEVIDLARRGLVRMPGFPADLFLNFMGMCVSRGSSVAADPDDLFDQRIATECLEELRELASMLPETIYSMNPIAIYEQMAAGDSFAYCPFAYTYSNYSRPGFGAHPINFTNPVALQDNVEMRTVLGGTGIAISSQCEIADIALQYCLFVSNRNSQRTLYGVCGGQPARRSAWEDPLLNQITDNFFSHTSASIETAYVRPRYQGYIPLQEQAGLPIADFLRRGGDATRALDQINNLYRSSLAKRIHDA